jgi:hypothetical protein
LKKSNEVGTVQAAAEAGPSSFTEARHAETAPPILGKEGAVEEYLPPKHLPKNWSSLCDMLRGNNCQRSRLPKLDNMPRI